MMAFYSDLYLVNMYSQSKALFLLSPKPAWVANMTAHSIDEEALSHSSGQYKSKLTGEIRHACEVIHYS